jgi:FecR protein
MKGTPPIPPLGDAAVGRIERGLWEALDTRPLTPARARGGKRRALAFSLAGVAAAGALFAVREGRRGESLPARAAQISTTTSGSHIAIAGAVLDVEPQSAVSFGGGRDGAVVVVLDRGTVTCEVEPRSKRAPFIVEAGATRVTVIGTRFSVHRVGEHATVTVEHGLVEVADTNMTELVHAGERYRPGEPITREALASQAPPATVPPQAAVPQPAPAAALTPTDPVPTPAPIPPVALARQPRQHRMKLADAAEASAATVVSPDGAPAARSTLADAVVAAPAVAAHAPNTTATDPDAATRAGAPRRSVQVLFELAAQLEVRDPEAALRIYEELAAGEDGWAASALFAAARLESERGQSQRARPLCESYLQRFPRGPNADDARTLLAR